MKQRILVLGADGFIGSNVVASLAATAWAVPIAGVRRQKSSRGDVVERRMVDATNGPSIAESLRGVDAVVNCVAGNSKAIELSAQELRTAVDAMPTQLNIVHMSTMSVYGDAEGVVDETTPCRGNIGAYSAAKLVAESALASYPAAVIFRPGCVYGPESKQWSERIARYLMARRLGDMGAAGDGVCNLVHIDDVVTAIVRALKNPKVGNHVYNLAGSGPLTWNEFLTRYAIALRAIPVRRITDRRLKVEGKILAPALKVIEILASAARSRIPGLPPPIPPSLIRLMRQNIRLDSGRAETELGLRWKDTDIGLCETAQWFLKHVHAA